MARPVSEVTALSDVISLSIYDILLCIWVRPIRKAVFLYFFLYNVIVSVDHPKLTQLTSILLRG